MKTKNKWKKGELVEHLLKLIENKNAFIAYYQGKYEGNVKAKSQEAN